MRGEQFKGTCFTPSSQGWVTWDSNLSAAPSPTKSFSEPSPGSSLEEGRGQKAGAIAGLTRRTPRITGMAVGDLI